jgi:hypothetical protein
MVHSLLKKVPQWHSIVGMIKTWKLIVLGSTWTWWHTPKTILIGALGILWMTLTLVSVFPIVFLGFGLLCVLSPVLIVYAYITVTLTCLLYGRSIVIFGGVGMDPSLGFSE